MAFIVLPYMGRLRSCGSCLEEGSPLSYPRFLDFLRQGPQYGPPILEEFPSGREWPFQVHCAQTRRRYALLRCFVCCLLVSQDYCVQGVAALLLYFNELRVEASRGLFCLSSFWGAATFLKPLLFLPVKIPGGARFLATSSNQASALCVETVQWCASATQKLL